MKIKNQVNISLIIFVILTVMIIFSVFSSNNRLQEIQKKQQVIDNIEKSSFELYYLENDYLIHGGTRPVERWNSIYAALTAQLKELTLTDPSQQAVLNGMFSNHRDLNTSFFNLVAITSGIQGTTPTPASQELKEFYSSTLTGQTQTLMSRSSELSQLVKAEASEVEHRTILIISTSIAGLMVFVVLNYLVINRSVLMSISAFQKGAERIGSGDLDTKIETKDNDELGELSLAFNDMAQKRKEVEKALRESEETFKALAENANDGILVAMAEGIHTFANRRAGEITGYSIAELLKTSIKDLAAPDEIENLIERFRKRLSGEDVPHQYETLLIHKDGKSVPIELSAAKTFWHGQPADLVIIRDITERKRVDEALKKGIQLLKDTGEMAKVGGWELDLSTKVVSWTEEVGRIHGVEPGYKPNLEEALNFYAPESRAAVEAGVKKTAETGEPYDLESLFIPLGSKDKIWVRSLGKAVYSDGKIVKLAGTFQNIDKYKRAEETLRETNEYLHKLIDYSNAPIIVWDPAFRITRFNEAFEHLTGRTEQEVLGQKIDILFPARSREALLALIKKTLEGERWKTVKIPILAADRTIHTVLWNSANILTADAELVSTIAQGVDVTQSERAEEALRESEQKYRNVVEDQIELICRFLPDGTHVFVNNAYCRYFDKKREEIIGHRFKPLLYPEDKDIVARHIASLTPLNPVVNLDQRIIMPDGSTRWQRWSDRAIFGENGRVIEYQSVGRDITDRKLAEEAIRSALAEKEVLLQEIHHRVKNNLSGIISLIDLQISYISDPVYISRLQDLETRIRSMSLVHESLSITKGMSQINIATYTENLIQHLLPIYGAGIDIRCKIDMGDITMPIETAIPYGMVMNEIVTNSLKHAFPKTFSCAEIRGEPCTIALTLHHEGNNYLLKIADNGIGIPEEIDVTMAQSLGLYLIRFIVKHQLMGSLEISTTGGSGYTIRFPEPVFKERFTDE